ncbi:MAG: alkaline phosphatase family protein [Acidobacteria bacterium]|nr:alkaline phosphatase family protein [Acidobacteriota bacterium]
MKRRTFLLWTIWALLLALPATPQQTGAQAKPRLVLGIVIDQFRYDYLTRFRPEYTAGFDRLLKDGAVFTNARYIHFPTVTAVGHSTFMTGATPAMSGIVGNEWYDRESGRMVTSVSDPETKLVGGGVAPGASPRKLLVSTVGDELKIADGGQSRVIGISLKDRSAILTAGHMADGAFWFDANTGNFVSSTFYFDKLPQWVAGFNQSRMAGHYAGAEWAAVDSSGTPFKKMPTTAGPALYGALGASPFGNDLVEALAERAIEAEQLGRHAVPDLLTVSFSSNDLVGHQAGPDSREVRDMSIRTDRLLGKFLQFVDAKVGLANTVVVLIGDHGVAPLPELNQSRKMPGGRLPAKAVPAAIQARLSQKYGEGTWISRVDFCSVYLNRDFIRQKNLDEGEVERTAADAARGVAHVARVYTGEQFLSGQTPGDPIGLRVFNGFYPPRAADLFIVPDPYWMISTTGTTHGNVFGYDTHVPVIFMGFGIKPGRYDGNIAPNDIAPTLATLLSVETPSGSVGRVLAEALAK